MLPELQSDLSTFQLLVAMFIFINAIFLQSISIQLGQRSGKTPNTIM